MITAIYNGGGTIQESEDAKIIFESVSSNLPQGWSDETRCPNGISIQSNACGLGVAIDDDIYFVSIWSALSPSSSDWKFAKYNISTKTWTRLADPENIHKYERRGILLHLDNYLYLIGGDYYQGVYKRVDRYDLENGMWEQIGDMPIGVSAPMGTVHNGKLIVFGGSTNYAQTTFNKDVFQYDPKTDKWSLLGEVPTEFRLVNTNGETGFCYDNNMVYCMHRNNYSPSVFYSVDFETFTWTRLPDGGSGFYGGAMGVLRGVVYYIGGYNGNTNNNRVIRCYDTSTEEWYTLENYLRPTNLYWGTAVVTKDRIYTTDRSASGSNSNLQVYSPGIGLRSVPSLGEGVAIFDKLTILNNSTKVPNEEYLVHAGQVVYFPEDLTSGTLEVDMKYETIINNL